MSAKPPHHAQWPLPQGVVDLVYQDAASKRDLEGTLRACFRAWSYDELIPPTFEYADTLASEAGTQLAEEMYRFTDRDGRTLALRPDLTIPAARVVATRLHDQPMPLRLFYVGSVFRYEAPQAGRQREFTQAGIELIGAGTPAADAEVLALTVSRRCARPACASSSLLWARWPSSAACWPSWTPPRRSSARCKAPSTARIRPILPVSSTNWLCVRPAPGLLGFAATERRARGLAAGPGYLRQSGHAGGAGLVGGNP